MGKVNREGEGRRSKGRRGKLEKANADIDKGKREQRKTMERGEEMQEEGGVSRVRSFPS